MQTTARSRPSRRPASTQSRTSRSSEPWCSAIVPAQSGRASRSAWYQISVCERTLVNTSVDFARSIARMTCGSILRPMWPAHGKRSIVAGSALTISIVLVSRPFTIRVRAGVAPARAGPTRHASASSRLASVAESPQSKGPA